MIGLKGGAHCDAAKTGEEEHHNGAEQDLDFDSLACQCYPLEAGLLDPPWPSRTGRESVKWPELELCSRLWETVPA